MSDPFKPVFMIAVVGIVVVGLSAVFNLSGANRTTAQTEARAYAQSLGLAVQGVECALSDTDGDGYVSCTLAVREANGSIRLEPIECASAITINSGCRMQKMGFIRR